MKDITSSTIDISDINQQRDIIISNKGDFKFSPHVGVGITSFLNDEDYTPMFIETKRQLQHDGMYISNISINDKKQLVINGNY